MTRGYRGGRSPVASGDGTLLGHNFSGRGTGPGCNRSLSRRGLRWREARHPVL